MSNKVRIKGGIDFDTSEVKKGIKDARKNVDGFKKSLNGLKGRVGQAFAVGAVGFYAKSVMDTTSQIGHMADSVGASTDVFQAFAMAVENTGGSMENARGAMGDLRQRADEARRGNQNVMDSFNRMGISADDLANRSLDDLLGMIAKSIKETNNFSDAAKLLGADNLRGVNKALLDIANEGMPAFIKAQKEAGRVLDEGVIREMMDAQLDMDMVGKRIMVLSARALNGFGTAGKAAKMFFNQLKEGDFGGSGMGFFNKLKMDLFFDINEAKLNRLEAAAQTMGAAAAPGSTLDEELQEILRKGGAEAGKEIQKATGKKFSNLRRIGANIAGDERNARRLADLAKRSLDEQKNQVDATMEVKTAVENLNIEESGDFVK